MQVLQLTSKQVLEMAPDPSSAANGKKLANTRHWKNLGQNTEAVWGECQGSALYQVRADTVTFSAKCTCPSHKFPCKHAIGLLLLATDAGNVPNADPPDWVTEWLSRRKATAAHKAEEHEKPDKPEKSPGQAPTDQEKRIQKRESLVLKGLDTLDLWMSDLVRNGLASVESQPATFWEHQAAQLVDAQASGIAGRVRRLSQIPGQQDWPDKLLGQLGRIALLSHAYRRAETLDPALREDIRQLVGWNVAKEDLAGAGEKITDEWNVVGQWEYEEDRLRVQHTWLLGTQSGRPALILQYSAMGRPYAETFLVGTKQVGDLYFYPGAAAIRGHLAERRGTSASITEIAPGAETIEEFLRQQSELLSRQPWQDAFLLVLREATPVDNGAGGTWFIRDRAGAALPLRKPGPWLLLALSGGAPLDFAGEWDGETVQPLSATVDGACHSLWRVS
jgi:SWIM zinc finger